MPSLNVDEIHWRSVVDINPVITTEMVNRFIAADGQPNNGYDIDRPTDSIYYNSLASATAESRCKCCGRQMYIPYYIDEGFCENCKALIAKEMFNPKNKDFTCNNVVNMIRGKINAV